MGYNRRRLPSLWLDDLVHLFIERAHHFELDPKLLSKIEEVDYHFWEYKT